MKIFRALLIAAATLSLAVILRLATSPSPVDAQSYPAPKLAGLTLAGPVVVQVRTATSTTDNISATADYFVCADDSSAAATENLPSSPTTGLTFLIKDCGGSAATHNITVTPASGNVDGASTYVMSTAYQSIAVTYTGSQWSIN
jgi:hypothetical protein